jgi:ectoine hydroxylase-related dioxygenase (phytanoyl-CoA dioxygenase family)
MCGTYEGNGVLIKDRKKPMNGQTQLQPTFRLRWLAKSNAVTAAEVQAYRDEHGGNMFAAKKILQNSKPAVLQQWHQDGANSEIGEWREIDYVVDPSPQVD